MYNHHNFQGPTLESCEYQELFCAWRVFIKGKRRSKVIDQFAYYIEYNLRQLTQQISNRTYVHNGYQRVIVHEKKRRDLAVASVRDRVVHRLVYDRLVNVYDKSFDADVWSCRTGKGLHKALLRSQNFLIKHNNSFVWRADIAKFFDHVNHQILINCLLNKLGQDDDSIWLCRQIISSYLATPGCGIPIGNLTSQIFANIYLNEFDRFVRHTLKPLAYLRYGDDFLLFATTRHQAIELRRLATEFLSNHLELNINHRNSITVSSSSGLHFLGHVITSSYITVDKFTTGAVLKKARVNNISSYKSLNLVETSKRQLDWILIDEIDEILDNRHI